MTLLIIDFLIFLSAISIAFISIPLAIINLFYLILTKLLDTKWINYIVLTFIILINIFTVSLVLGLLINLAPKLHLQLAVALPLASSALFNFNLTTLLSLKQLQLSHYLTAIIITLPIVLRLISCIADAIEYRQPITLVAASNNDMKTDTTTDSPQGVMLGVTLTNQQPLCLFDHELNHHCLVLGTTGSGKTTTLLKIVESACQRNLPLIYIDGKGSFDLITKIQQLTTRYQRKFKFFTLTPNNLQAEQLENLAGYNPFSSGNATEWKNRLMSLFAQISTKGQEHFSLAEQNYINFVVNILAKLNKPVDLRVILGFLEQPDKLLAVAQTIDAEIGYKLAKLHHDNADIQKLVGDVVKLLELFIYSDYGGLFNTLQLHNVIKLKESIINNEIILFLFNAATYPEDTNKIAKMVINDINSSFSNLKQYTKCFCIFDEFASYASHNLAETISLQRSNGLHAIIGTQSIATVKLKSNDTARIAEELLACCNNFIIHRINHHQDAQIMAQLIGMQQNWQISSTYSNNSNSSNDNNFIINANAANNINTNYSKTIKPIEEFKIAPQILKELITGQAMFYSKIRGDHAPILISVYA